jgi:hypothetical protein
VTGPVRGSYIDVVATTTDTLRVTVNPLQLVEQLATVCAGSRVYTGAFTRLTMAREMLARTYIDAPTRKHWERVAEESTDALRRIVYSTGAMTLELDADDADALRSALDDGLADLVGVNLRGVDDEPDRDELGARPVEERAL